MTEVELEELGLPLGPRKRILKVIASLAAAQKTSGVESRGYPQEVGLRELVALVGAE
jgi:hypothetical protein